MRGSAWFLTNSQFLPRRKYVLIVRIPSPQFRFRPRSHTEHSNRHRLFLTMSPCCSGCSKELPAEMLQSTPGQIEPVKSESKLEPGFAVVSGCQGCSETACTCNGNITNTFVRPLFLIRSFCRFLLGEISPSDLC